MRTMQENMKSMGGMDGAITVAFMDPEAVLQLVDNPEVQALGKQVRALLQRVCVSLGA